MKLTPSTSQLSYWIEAHPDRGCLVAPACLECPLPACLYEAAEPKPSVVRSALRAAKIQAARASEGLTLEELAARFGISQRGVSRALAREDAA